MPRTGPDAAGVDDDEDGEAVRYTLALAFDTDDMQFVRGVEIGRLWEQIKAADEDEAATHTIHLANTEMALRIGEALRRAVAGDALDDTWTTVTFSAAIQ